MILGLVKELQKAAMEQFLAVTEPRGGGLAYCSSARDVRPNRAFDQCYAFLREGRCPQRP
jgi:hypothetical protein